MNLKNIRKQKNDLLIKKEFIEQMKKESEIRNSIKNQTKNAINAQESKEFVNKYCLSSFSENAVVVGTCKYTLNCKAHSGIVIEDSEEISILDIEPVPFTAFHNHHVLNSFMDEYNRQAVWMQKFSNPEKLYPDRNQKGLDEKFLKNI
jgi:hypothetical protein